MNQVIVCKLEVTRKAGNKNVALSCFIKIVNDPLFPVPSYFLWERYRGDLMFLNFCSNGACRHIPPTIELFPQSEGFDKYYPLVTLFSPPPDLNRLMPPPILYLGDGALYPSNEDLKWTIGLCDANNLPT